MQPREANTESPSRRGSARRSVVPTALPPSCSRWCAPSRTPTRAIGFVRLAAVATRAAPAPRLQHSTAQPITLLQRATVAVPPPAERGLALPSLTGLPPPRRSTSPSPSCRRSSRSRGTSARCPSSRTSTTACLGIRVDLTNSPKIRKIKIIIRARAPALQQFRRRRLARVPPLRRSAQGLLPTAASQAGRMVAARQPQAAPPHHPYSGSTSGTVGPAASCPAPAHLRTPRKWLQQPSRRYSMRHDFITKKK